MTTAILAPWAKDEVTRLGQQVFKKEILRFGHVKTDDQEFDFTPEFGAQLVEAFKAGVIPTVPLVLADEDNRHTQEVSRERIGGEVIGLELANDGLYGIIRANDKAAPLIEDNPRLPVSIRALQGRMDNDGRRWPAVLNHVLATFDPVVTGMGEWEAITLSHDSVTEVIDLANPAGSNGKGNRMPKEIAGSLSTEELESLYGLLGKALGKDGDAKDDDGDEQRPETDESQNPEDENEDDGEAAQADDADLDELDLGGLTDEELEKLLLDEEVTESVNPEPAKGEVVDGNGEVVEEERERELVEASNSGASAIELANARAKEQAIELARLRAEVDSANYEKERDQLVRATGLPPRIIDLARPLLEGAGRTVELSNGKKADAGKVVREVFGEIGKTLKALDLSNPTGFGMEADDPDEDVEKERVDFVDTVKKQFRLG